MREVCSRFKISKFTELYYDALQQIVVLVALVRSSACALHLFAAFISWSMLMHNRNTNMIANSISDFGTNYVIWYVREMVRIMRSILNILYISALFISMGLIIHLCLSYQQSVGNICVKQCHIHFQVAIVRRAML